MEEHVLPRMGDRVQWLIQTWPEAITLSAALTSLRKCSFARRASFVRRSGASTLPQLVPGAGSLFSSPELALVPSPYAAFCSPPQQRCDRLCTTLWKTNHNALTRSMRFLFGPPLTERSITCYRDVGVIRRVPTERLRNSLQNERPARETRCFFGVQVFERPTGPIAWACCRGPRGELCATPRQPDRRVRAMATGSWYSECRSTQPYATTCRATRSRPPHPWPRPSRAARRERDLGEIIEGGSDEPPHRAAVIHPRRAAETRAGAKGES
jgi:hypothetical protein